MTRWQEIGWQGIELSVPDDWNPCVVDGDFGKGYLKFSDLGQVRLEIKWQKQRFQPDARYLARSLTRRGTIKKEEPLNAMGWLLREGLYIESGNGETCYCVIAYSRILSRAILARCFFERGGFLGFFELLWLG